MYLFPNKFFVKVRLYGVDYTVCEECKKKVHIDFDIQKHKWTYHPKNSIERAWANTQLKILNIGREVRTTNRTGHTTKKHINQK